MKKKYGLVMVCIFLCLTIVLAGCGGNSGSTDSSKNAKGSSGDSSKPFDLTIMLPQQAVAIPQPDSPIVSAISKYTNTNLHFQWSPGDGYYDKLSVMLASGELPQVIFSKFKPSIMDPMKAGMFWEIGPYLKDYKNLSKLNPKYFSNLAVNGKEYAMPDIRAMARDAFIYRKDWYDSMGVSKLPTTLDGWLKVFRDQVKAHPGTYGFEEESGLKAFGQFVIMNGGYNGWGVKDGKLVPDFMGPAYMDVMKFFKTLYSEHLINQSFPTKSDKNIGSDFFAGKSGMIMGVALNTYTWEQNVQKADPKAVLDVEPMVGPNGVRTDAGTGNNGFLLISKSAVKSEDEMKRILGFYDKLLDPEMANLLTYGIEGTDYKVVDGQVVVTDSKHYSESGAAALYNGLPANHGSGNELPLQAKPLEVKSLKITKENEQYGIGDPTDTLYSDTFAKKGKELTQIIDTAVSKFIMGESDESGFNDAIAQWKKSGGDQMTKEFNTAYQEQQKK